jgi:predicted nucleic acid-binding protein
MAQLTLPSSGLVYLDAQILIYSVEKQGALAAAVRPVWQAAHDDRVELVTSELSVLECLVGPLRKGDVALANDYHRLFESRGLELLPVTREVLVRAAELRASSSLRTPDAIHLASAIEAGCGLFVTNDQAFRRAPGMRVVVVGDLLRDG